MDEYLKTFIDMQEAFYCKDKTYELSIKDLQCLCRDFQADCYDGFVSNDESYIEYWLEKNGYTGL